MPDGWFIPSFGSTSISFIARMESASGFMGMLYVSSFTEMVPEFMVTVSVVTSAITSRLFFSSSLELISLALTSSVLLFSTSSLEFSGKVSTGSHTAKSFLSH
uniref:Uncharacterized protein n=1 Tax=Anguilla anguilla TaxID=7936 RepID=A0A0E9SFL9_ANGAN